MSDNEYVDLASIQRQQVEIIALRIQLDEARVADQRHQGELADTNRNHRHAINGLELHQVEDAAQAASLRLEAEEAASFQSTITAHETAKIHLNHQQVLRSARRHFHDELAVKSRLLADEKHTHTHSRGATWVLLLVQGQLINELRMRDRQLQGKTTELANEKADHAATKASLATLKAAHDELRAQLADKDLLHEVMVVLRGGKEVDHATVNRLKDICTKRKALEEGESMTAEGLYRLALKMLDHETITINNISYNKKELLIGALGKDAHHASSYCNLSLLMADGETVTVDGTTSYTKKELLIKALEMGGNNLYTYYWLGGMLSGDETVTINDNFYSRKECFKKAMENNPLHAHSQNNLGAPMISDGTAPATPGNN